ncbi:phage tail sheath family protein [Longirhabdus pacifica]|uniref:phage tail sheath family protein n=1 Tax=Longirhabdus pacifica TaxID=2305227 RepID=UPI001008B0E8|nr:phage tail sheath family protein [Longirhabdus pacifica]
MALGGGTFLTQNKSLPGSYINFVSAARASATLSERGYVAMPLSLDWGAADDIVTLEAADFGKEAMKLFGYSPDAPQLQPIREVLRHAKTVYFYRLNGGTKAEKTEGSVTITAKHSGVRGNHLKVGIVQNADDNTLFEVSTYVDTKKVDTQIVSTIDALVDNDYVMFSGTGAPTASAGITLEGGTNKAAVDADDYQTFLNKAEAYAFNTLACPSATPAIISLFVEYTKRMREENGIKFQTVVYRSAADHEGVISVENTVKGEQVNAASLVYWTAGVTAACAINQSNSNTTYDGEYDIDVDYTQSELAKGLKEGKFLFHKVGDKVNILDDINTFVSVTPDKNEDFSSNQVVRVLDQVANDTAVLFNQQYLGKVQNNDTGRSLFWNELVTYFKQLQNINAIEAFQAEDIVVEQGADKKSISVSNSITPTAAMTKCYMTVVVQ